MVKIRNAELDCAATFEETKDFIVDNLPEDEAVEHDFQFGFIEPGHGLKGKKEWITTDEDVEEMFEKHNGKKDITLWCYRKPKGGKSRSISSRSRSPNKKGSRYEAHSKQISEVDDIYKQLKDKHTGSYTPEQLRAWAHLIQLGKHQSYDNAPNKPFFRGKLSDTKQATAVSEVKTPCKEKRVTVPDSFSPGRRVTLRTQCIDQLQKWHSLLESGAITRKQYDELQETILTDIKHF